jgi:hypothetical protein
MPLKTKDFTMTIQPGELWIAEISCTNGLAAKKRPVLVFSGAIAQIQGAIAP